jgi:hypothetical protein
MEKKSSLKIDIVVSLIIAIIVGVSVYYYAGIPKPIVEVGIGEKAVNYLLNPSLLLGKDKAENKEKPLSKPIISLIALASGLCTFGVIKLIRYIKNKKDEDVIKFEGDNQ